jgi:hypothetical protein
MRVLTLLIMAAIVAPQAVNADLSDKASASACSPICPEESRYPYDYYKQLPGS